MKTVAGEGLEETEKITFGRCSSRQRLVVPLAVRMINNEAFYRCSGLMTVHLGDGVEYIGMKAFIAPTHRDSPRCRINTSNAFFRCLQLRNMEFCPEIECVRRVYA